MPAIQNLVIKSNSRHKFSQFPYEEGSVVVDFAGGATEVYVDLDTAHATYGNVLVGNFYSESDPERAAQANEQLTITPFTIDAGRMTIRVSSPFGTYYGELNLSWRIL